MVPSTVSPLAGVASHLRRIEAELMEKKTDELFKLLQKIIKDGPTAQTGDKPIKK